MKGRTLTRYKATGRGWKKRDGKDNIDKVYNNRFLDTDLMIKTQEIATSGHTDRD